MLRLSIYAALFSLICLGAVPVRAGDAIDTRVTFTIADDNIVHGPEETASGSPSIPNFRPTSRNRLFFDDYERRDRGFENLTYLVLYGHQPGFFEGLDTEAALVLRAEILNETANVRMREDGSYINVIKNFADSKLTITAFPVSANRFQLGYSFDIAWGGSEIFKGAAAVPGLRVRWENDLTYAFLGFKATTTQIVTSDGSREQDTVWGVLGGAGIDVVDELRIELGAGFFDRGIVDKQELIIPTGDGEFDTAPWQAFGASAQVSYHVGMPIGTPIDFRLYRNDPLKQQSFFTREQYNDELSFVVQAEFSALGQTLQDPERPTSTVIQPAVASDLSARFKIGKLRFAGLGVYRNLAFILFNVPSLSFIDFPDGIDTIPELFFSFGMDYFIESAELTPGFVVGVQRPASQTGSAVTDTQQTIVYRTDTDIDILDPGDDVELVYAGKLTGRWDLSEILSTVGEFQVSYDRNRRRFERDTTGIATSVADDPTIIGFNLMLQARF